MRTHLLKNGKYLCSADRSMCFPLRLSTARLSPTLAMTTLSLRASSTVAVAPDSSSSPSVLSAAMTSSSQPLKRETIKFYRSQRFNIRRPLHQGSLKPSCSVGRAGLNRLQAEAVRKRCICREERDVRNCKLLDGCSPAGPDVKLTLCADDSKALGAISRICS